MKLASLKNGQRDGALVVVDRKLNTCVRVPQIAATMQQAIETWSAVAPKLQAVYEQLNGGKADGAEPFSPERAESPLPRAYQFLDGSVYLSHMRKARAAYVFLAGMVIAVFVSIPLINLATPIFAMAFMVHMHKKISGPRAEPVEAAN